MSSASSSSSDHLGRNLLRTPDVVFLVIAAAAPMGAMVGALPIVVALGNGPGAPGAYLYAALALGCFAAGYAAMSRRITNAGAFYAYIAKGIGRPVGIGAAYVALISYTTVAIGVAAALGFFAEGIMDAQLGIHMSWYVWSGIAVAITAVLGFREISISARVLGVALALEVLILVVLDVGIIADRGLSAFSLSSFSPDTVFSGSAGIAFLFAFNSFIGFEATAIFGEESRDPKRTVPRATYWAIGLIGGFYALTSWCLVSYYGSANVQEAAGADPSAFVFGVNADVVSTLASNTMQVLLVTSFVASLLGLHNAAARYFFALGRERVVPHGFGHTHPKHGSPWVGSLTVTACTALPIVGVAIGGGDPYLGLAAGMLALGTIGIVGLQSAASLSAVVFFQRTGERIQWWTMVVGPAIGAVALAIAVYLGIDNYALLTGKESGWQNHLPWLLAAVLVIGVGFGLYLRGSRPDIYRQVGGDEVEPLEVEREREQVSA